MKILFTSDLHGNEEQYRKLVHFAVDDSASAVIIGGDLAPKDEPMDYIGSQRRFFEKRFPELMRELQKGLPDANVYLMMGNDDCASNLDVFMRYDGELYKDLHMRRYTLNEDFDIAGYANVPITPFGLKDWERYDLSNGETAHASVVAQACIKVMGMVCPYLRNIYGGGKTTLEAHRRKI